jgi:hypothetical protein
MWFLILTVAFLFLLYINRQTLVPLVLRVLSELYQNKKIATLIQNFLSKDLGEIRVFNEQVCEVSYGSSGVVYKILVPFKKRTPPTNKRVILLVGDKKVDITQQRGLPYFVTPKMLGGTVVICGEDERRIVPKTKLLWFEEFCHNIKIQRA